MSDGLWKWLIRNLATLLTIGWVGYIIGLAVHSVPHYTQLDLNELGDFFAGAVGPIALLWLVLGYRQQNNAISIQSEELRAAVDQHRAQVEATQSLAANETRQTRIEYYRLLSQCAKDIVSCQLLLEGDTITNTEISASKGPSILGDELLRSIETMNAQINASTIVQMVRSKQQARPGEILQLELKRIVENQKHFEKITSTLHELDFSDLELSSLSLVNHNSAIQNLLSRSELFLKLQESRLNARSSQD